MSSITNQYDIFIVPALITNDRKITPDRFIGYKFMTIQFFFKHILKISQSLQLSRTIKTSSFPCIFMSFQNPSRRGLPLSLSILIGVVIKPTMIIGLENKCECIKFLVSTKPHKFSFSYINRWLKMFIVSLSYNTINTIGSKY